MLAPYQKYLCTNSNKRFISHLYGIHNEYQEMRSYQFAASTQKIQVGNGQCVSVLFNIPVIIEVHGHRFEIYILVSEIHENVDLVLGIKNVFKLEGVINSRDCRFKF